MYRSFSLSRKKKKSKTIQCIKLRNWDAIEDKDIRNLSNFEARAFPQTSDMNSSKCFSEIYRAQYENAILVYLRGTPIWRLENSVNIWNLLWLSR